MNNIFHLLFFMNKLILWSIFLFWSILHIYLWQLNEVLKVADSFAYLQMSHYLESFSTEGFWTGWFGFLYSLPIACLNYFLSNDFLSAQIINITLFNLSAFLLFVIGKRYLDPLYVYVLLILFFLSPILLHFNIAILSENIYIPLFLLVVLLGLKFSATPKIRHWIWFWFLLALMYLTRWEAFIYLWAVWIISIFVYLFSPYKKLTRWEFLTRWFTKKFFWFNILLLLSFWLFVAPYVYHLNSITWEWWLSNKWSSNLRQATLRGKEKMDDSGFEQAVAELTPDSKKLIAGFAGWLDYDTPETGITLQNYIIENPKRFITNWLENQKKLYSKNLPHIIVWEAWTLYFNEDSELFYKNKLFLVLVILPLIFFVLGIIQLFRNKKYPLLIILGSFYFIASMFFTLFFTLNRYFVIFLPLFLLIIVYGIQHVNSIITFTWTGFSKREVNQKRFAWKNVFKALCALAIIWVYTLGTFSYYNTHKDHDKQYIIKKEAGEWLQKNAFKMYENELCKDSIWCVAKISRKEYRANLKILERFPITTYYSWTQKRFITPYTNSLSQLLIYAKHNKIDYLIVDSLDFQKYRPLLYFLLDEKKEFEWIKAVKTFKKQFKGKMQKVIIYKIL